MDTNQTTPICINCMIQLDKVKKHKHLKEEDIFILENPKRTLKVHYPVRMDNGKVKIISAIRVQYNDAMGPTKGGVRFHESVNEREVTELAFLMGLKTALAGLPYGGAKGGITINPKNLSEGELERVARGYIREMFKIIGPHQDIPAPDVNTNPKIMGFMLDEYERHAGRKTPGVITGKPLLLGGSLGRNSSTAKGAFYLIEERFKDIEEKSNLKVAIQGFGNAGSHIATLLEGIGFKVVAVSDSKTGLYNKEGLNLKELVKWKEDKKSFKEYKHAKHISNDSLLELDVDILIPAALGSVITYKNAENIKAPTIVELANAPISAEADDIIEKKCEVVPDILANSGGVIVSYFEWVQNLQNFYWTKEEVQTRLKEKILKAYSEVLEEQQKHKLTTLRTASYTLAISRILDAERMRGNL